jgi:lipopolysaccharide export system permease protein
LKEAARGVKRWLLVLALLALGIFLCFWRLPIEKQNVADHLRGFPEASTQMHGLRVYILAVVFLLPALAAFFYATSNVLNRWLTREFLHAFLICFGGILAVYMLLDFSSKESAFEESGSVLFGAWRFYSEYSPALLTLLLPFGMLLSVLFCVGKVSRSRELVAALQSGVSMWRLMLPIYGFGVLATLFCIACNFHWAPQSEGMKSANLDEVRGKTGIQATDLVFFYPKGRRMWKVANFPREFDQGVPLTGVEVTTLHKDGSLASRLYADEAKWSSSLGQWQFSRVELADHHKNQAPIFVNPMEPYIKDDWNETPAQIIQQGAGAQYLGVPDLTGMMKNSVKEEWQQSESARYATQWHYRWALPLSCFVYVLVAVPLALFVTRRASGASIAVAIGSAIFMVLLTSVLLALGESENMNSALAVWLPIGIFTALGFLLMLRRNAGRALWPIFGK